MSRDRISQVQNTQQASMPQNNGQKAIIAARLPYQKQQLSYLQGKLSDMRASNEQLNSENGNQPNYFREAQQMREAGYISQISSLQQEISSGSVSLGNLNSSDAGIPSSNQGNSSGTIGNFNSSGSGISSGGAAAASGGSTIDDVKSV